MSERQIPVLKLGQDMVYPNGPQPAADELSRKLFEAVEPALVQIRTDGSKSGTGFFAGDNNRVVTSASVVLGSSEQFVIGRDGLRYKAQIESIDDVHNLAVLSIKGQGPEHGTLSLNNGKGLTHDARVTAFGFPADSQSAYVSPGYFRHYSNPAMFLRNNHSAIFGPLAEKISKLPEDEQKEAVQLLSRPLIQTATNVRKGFAGSPLLDADGNVRGINTMTNAGDMTDVYFAPAEFAQKLLDSKDPKFAISYDYAPAQWAGRYMQDWRENQLTAATETAFAGGIGYLGWRAFNRLPNVAGSTVGVVGLTMLAGDAQKYLASTDSRDDWKYGLASVADLGTASGAFLSMVPKARAVGFAVMGASIVGRMATDFIHNRWALQEIKRTDGVDRPPMQIENMLR